MLGSFKKNLIGADKKYVLISCFKSLSSATLSRQSSGILSIREGML